MPGFDSGGGGGTVSPGTQVFKGAWDASAGTFPGSGAAKQGWVYRVSVAGTVDSQAFTVGDYIVALVDNASTSTYAANWQITNNVMTQAEWDALLAATTSISTFTKTLLDDADAPTFRQTLGAQYVFVKFDAAECIPRTTTGAGIDSTETSTNLINRDGLLFDPVTSEFAQAWFHWPEGWNTVTATFFWQCATGTGNVAWTARIRIFTDGDPIDSAFGTAQSVTDAAGSANTHRQSDPTPAITPGGVVGAGKRAILGVSRDTSIGSNMALDAMLTGVLLLRAS